MLYFRNKEEYHRYLYQKELKKTANGLGFMLLTIFAFEIIFDVIIVAILKRNDLSTAFATSSILEMLTNGMLSSLLFFAVGAIYALAKKRSFGALFPFEKIGAKRLFMLCTAGIAVSLLSNLASEMTTNVFGLFGLQNTGGEIDFGGTLPSVLMYYLTVAVMPAFTEEFAFRGVIMGSLRKYSDAMALVVSSGLFALMHGNFVQMPFTFCCGMMFGFLVLKTESLLPGIIVHFLNNGLSVTLDLLYQYKIINAPTVSLIYGAVIVVTSVLGLIFIRRFTKEDDGFFRLSGANDVLPYRQKLKTVVSSPTMISFAAIMMLFSVYVLLQPYLVQWGVIKY